MTSGPTLFAEDDENREQDPIIDNNGLLWEILAFFLG
jgi:hypothetical protein